MKTIYAKKIDELRLNNDLLQLKIPEKYFDQLSQICSVKRDITKIDHTDITVEIIASRDYIIGYHLKPRNTWRSSDAGLSYYIEKIQTGNILGTTYFNFDSIKIKNFPKTNETMVLDVLGRSYGALNRISGISKKTNKIYQDFSDFKKEYVKNLDERSRSSVELTFNELKIIHILLDFKFDGAAFRKAPRTAARHLTKVFENKNKRYVFMNEPKTYGDDTYKMFVVDPASPEYNYLDEGTFCAMTNGEIAGELQFTNTVKKEHLPRDLKNLINYVNRSRREDASRRVVVMDEKRIEFIEKSAEKKQALEQTQEKAEKSISEKLNKKLKLVTDLKPLKVNDVFIYPNKIVYENQEIKSMKVKCPELIYQDLHYSWQYNQINLDSINFDVLFERFLIEYISASTNNPDVNILAVFGDVKADLISKSFTNKSRVTSLLRYINGYRINAAELNDVLSRSLCFTEQSTFDSFLKQVSKCSLRFHSYLGKGLNISVQNPFEYTDRIQLKLTISRDKRYNYLEIGKNKYLIKNSNRFLNLDKARDMSTLTSILTDSTVIDGVLISDIQALVKEGRLKHHNSLKKSKELLEKTMKKFGLTQVTEKIDKTTRQGFIVQGQKSKYFIENDIDLVDGSGKCGVYRYPSGQYVCIVDKSLDQVGLDKLVNRIYALQNDSRLVHQIHTL
jgi:hypothetical protein